MAHGTNRRSKLIVKEAAVYFLTVKKISDALSAYSRGFPLPSLPSAARDTGILISGFDFSAATGEKRKIRRENEETRDPLRRRIRRGVWPHRGCTSRFPRPVIAALLTLR